MPLWQVAPPRGATAAGRATGCWPGVATGLGRGAAAGRAAAGLTGEGAGWADTDDERTKDAAMVVTMARKKGIGIIVTGSHQEETGIFTACEQDLRKPNCLIRPPIHRLQRGSAHLSRSSSKNEGGSPIGQTPTYPATNRRKRAWRI